MIASDAGRNRHCSVCHGSGRCQYCFGSGVNVHLNEPEPNCKICRGDGRCGGSGRPQFNDRALSEFPIAGRLIFSVFPVLAIAIAAYAQVCRAEFDLRGSATFACILDFYLYLCWKDVKLEDVRLVLNRKHQFLFGETRDPRK